MQAKNPLPEKIRDAFRSFVEAAGGLSRFQTAVIITLLTLMAAGGVLSYVRSRPRPVEVREARGDDESSSERMLMVHVAGAVMKPGLYRLRESSRVDDALSEAGGPAPDALLDDLNLAARVKDGQRVLVPRSAPGDAEGDETGPVQDEGTPGLINVNTATVAELEGLPGIGPSLARRIVDYRRRKGPFSSVDEIDNVEGIGPGKLESLQGLVTI